MFYLKIRKIMKLLFEHKELFLLLNKKYQKINKNEKLNDVAILTLCKSCGNFEFFMKFIIYICKFLSNINLKEILKIFVYII